MKCLLCLKDKDLIKSSRIIPDFMYKDLFDEKHRLIRTTGLDVPSAKKLQTGEREGNILCQQCDNVVLGSLEGYACRVLVSWRSYVQQR